jgi:hypothetical protein
MSGYYRRYERNGDLSICVDKDNSILSVENLAQDKTYVGEIEGEPIFELPPGAKFTRVPYGKLYEDELRIYQLNKRLNYFDDEEEVEDGDTGGWDCHD